MRPQSSHFRYSTGRASERPMILAFGTPQRGQTMPEVDRLAIGLYSLLPFRLQDPGERYKPGRAQRVLVGRIVIWTAFRNFTGVPLTIAGR